MPIYWHLKKEFTDSNTLRNISHYIYTHTQNIKELLLFWDLKKNFFFFAAAVLPAA